MFLGSCCGHCGKKIDNKEDKKLFNQIKKNLKNKKDDSLQDVISKRLNLSMREESLIQMIFFMMKNMKDMKFILMKQSKRQRINLIKQDMVFTSIENINTISMTEWMENKPFKMQLIKEFFMY